MRTLFIALSILVVGSFAFGQFTTLNPQGQVFGYASTVVDARAYAQNTTDTLPNASINNWYAASPQTYNVGGVSRLTYQFIVSDSCTVVLHFDVLEGNTYTALTAVSADSITVTQSDTVEVVLRSDLTDRLGGTMGRRVRVREEFRNVTQGTTSATRTSRWLWKP